LALFLHCFRIVFVCCFCIFFALFSHCFCIVVFALLFALFFIVVRIVFSLLFLFFFLHCCFRIVLALFSHCFRIVFGIAVDVEQEKAMDLLLTDDDVNKLSIKEIKQRLKVCVCVLFCIVLFAEIAHLLFFL
jgi:hypothetical protein